MKARLAREFFILVVSFALPWFLITKLAPVPKDFSIQLSVEQEEKLGNILTDMVLESEEKVHEPMLDSAVSIIFNRLKSNLDSSQYHYKFQVIKSDQVNAFTLPGGNIIILTGFIGFTESPEEAAAVIAHEMGHVEHRDVVSRLIKDVGINVVLAILLKTDKTWLGEIGKTALSTVFDRQQELSADQFALHLMAKSGIKPYALATFFRRMSEEGNSYDKRLEILMTHPHDDKRIQQALEYSLPENFVERKFEELDWDEVRKSVKEDFIK